MFERILVPLDGSHLAEAALPATCEIAKRFGSRIILLQALPLEGVLPVAGAVAETQEEEMDLVRQRSELDEQASNEYLTHLVNEFAAEGIAAEAAECSGDPAEAILSYLEGAEISLLVISSHGRGGLGRLVFGSVADKLLRASRVPMLVIHSKPDGA